MRSALLPVCDRFLSVRSFFSSGTLSVEYSAISNGVLLAAVARASCALGASDGGVVLRGSGVGL